jgi:plastocyanin
VDAKKVFVPLILTSALALGACGGDEGTPTVSSPEAASPKGEEAMHRPAARVSCAADGNVVQLSAEQIAYTKDCLAVHAGEDFTIHFQNQDANTNHSVQILSADPASDPDARTLFDGKVITGVSAIDYRVSALAEGSYHFHCEVHPSQMFGTLLAR